MKVNEVKGLIDQYGEQATLGEILKKYKVTKYSNALSVAEKDT